MKASEIYTAQEMREMEAIVAAGDIRPMTRERVALMLKQAAEMRERAYAVIAKAKKANETQTSFGCRTCVENDIKEINYILRGDAEEGAGDGFKRD